MQSIASPRSSTLLVSVHRARTKTLVAAITRNAAIRKRSATALGIAYEVAGLN